MSSLHESFRVPEFDGMYDGKAELHVPTQNNIVQIGVQGPAETATLHIEKDDGSVSAWLPGGMLQVYVNEVDTPDPFKYYYAAVTELVFGKPVPKITFELTKSDEHSPIWTPVGEGLEVRSQVAMEIFAQKLGRYAHHKLFLAAMTGSN